MSNSINRLLSRRKNNTTNNNNNNKDQEKKVMSPSAAPNLSTPGSSTSVSFRSSSASFPLSLNSGHSSSTSCSSLSLAFSAQRPKRSPRLQATDITIHASTANTYDRLLLQPKQTSGRLFGIFPEDRSKYSGSDDEAKVKDLSERLSHVGVTDISDQDLGYVLKTTFANDEVEKAFKLLDLFEKSDAGIIKVFDPHVKMKGAVNRRGVSCYLDSLFFAMFARMGSFEAMLYNTFEDEKRKRLVCLIRLWVNILRSGELVTAEITSHLQEQLAECGWKEAAEIRQQDASEAFSFITEILALPLLTLKMDIFHTGKEDVSDDHKLIHERLLEVSVPEEPKDGSAITLEDCLETYFNNRIEVRRYLQRKNTLTSVRSRNSVDSRKGYSLHIESAEVNGSQPSSPLEPSPVSACVPSRIAFARHRAPSIIQEHYVTEKSELYGLFPAAQDDEDSLGRQHTGSVRKEVMMPAWQFFSLIPWYDISQPSTDAQVAAHFSSKRPVLGLCLKRYSMLPNGRAVRRNTHIDVPLEIGLPHFVQDDNSSEDGPIFGNFKLSLQSVVCHRGNSVHSGHYVSLVRSPASSTIPVAIDGSSTEPETDKWMLFDDLAKERVKFVDIEKALKAESPYLLFYQVQPLDGDPGNIEDRDKPPSHTDSEGKDSGVAGLSEKEDSKRTVLEDPEDVGRSSVESAVDDLRGRAALASERRPSKVFADNNNESIKPDQHQDLSGTPPRNGIRSFAASRRNSKMLSADSRIRASSPSGEPLEKRLSASLTRLAGRFAKDKPDGAALTIPAPDTETQNSQHVEVAVPATMPDKQRGADQLKHKHGKADKSNHRLSGHHHLGKGRTKSQKPDRECVVM